MDEFINQAADRFKTVKVFFMGETASPHQNRNAEQYAEEEPEDELARLTSRALAIGQAMQPSPPPSPPPRTPPPTRERIFCYDTAYPPPLGFSVDGVDPFEYLPDIVMNYYVRVPNTEWYHCPGLALCMTGIFEPTALPRCFNSFYEDMIPEELEDEAERRMFYEFIGHLWALREHQWDLAEERAEMQLEAERAQAGNEADENAAAEMAVVGTAEVQRSQVNTDEPEATHDESNANDKSDDKPEVQDGEPEVKDDVPQAEKETSKADSDQVAI
ncbi:hypothetical protein F5Y04DRAFT_237262 [Hypomontagnella monticulosa]|nr:hypothetical protein F5Y04DRAFT_237262 [Hypomontagnella monticulosa]